MVAFVDDEVSVVGDPIVDDALPDQALNDRDIDPPSWLVPTAADATDVGRWHVQECRQAGNPLIE